MNKRNVVNDPSKNMNACEDFFVSVVEAHILAVTMSYFNMSSLEDNPVSILFANDCHKLEFTKRHTIPFLEIGNIINEFVDISFDNSTSRPEDNDKVVSYACDILSLGLLYIEFVDGIRQGNGDRIMRCWKYFLLYFKSSNHTNYSIEAFILLATVSLLISPRMAVHLKCNRTVNIHGRQGKNIPCDLYMEHLNRECKNCICGLGSNISDSSVQRIGKCIGRTQ